MNMRNNNHSMRTLSATNSGNALSLNNAIISVSNPDVDYNFSSSGAAFDQEKMEQYLSQLDAPQSQHNNIIFNRDWHLGLFDNDIPLRERVVTSSELLLHPADMSDPCSLELPLSVVSSYPLINIWILSIKFLSLI
jgi:hypothetical protein